MLVAGAVVAAGCVSTDGDEADTTDPADTVASTPPEPTDPDDDPPDDTDVDPDPQSTEPDDDPSPPTTTSNGTDEPPPTEPSATTVRPDAEAADTTPPDAGGLPSLTEGDPDTTVGTLENGLRYLIRENDNPGQKVELRLVIDAGSGLEDETQVGGAHFLEHMLFNGTEEYPRNELIDVLRSFGASFGADVNAYTSYDETVYSLTVPTGDPDVVRTGLDVLEEWLSAATLAEDDVVAERGVVLDEWRVRDQTAAGRLFDRTAEFFLAGTAYDGHAPIGGADAIRETAPDPLRRFYDDWYRPDNAAIVVVGDIGAGEIEQQVIERFSDETARGEAFERPVLEVAPPTQPRARVESDPDLAEGYAFVTLPRARQPLDTIEEDALWELYRGLAFDVIATRLNNDALRGEAPYDSAEVADSEFVRQLVAPEIYVTVDGDDVEAAVEAVLDEYERVRRFGFRPGEIARATGRVLSAARTSYDGRGSRQDVSYADEYVDHVLTGDPYVTAQREFDFITEAMERATPENVAHVFVEHLGATGAHVFAAVPSAEADDAPAEAALVDIATTAPQREIEPRDESAAIGDELVARPDPIVEVDTEQLADQPFPGFIDPVVLTFPNGVRVAFNTNQIVEGQVFVQGRSPGGLAVLADDDVPDGDALRAVVGDSGVGDFDRVAIEEFLDGKEVELGPSLGQFEEQIDGFGATADLEVLFQMIHLTMTEPRVDPVALEQYVDDQLPFAANPGLDSGYAEFVALQDARYDDIRFLAPTPETLATVDAAGIERVMADRFGDAGDWTFSFSGDFDTFAAIELARSYLATLPATDRVETPGYAEEPPPDGVVVVETQAGEGETANVSFLFTSQTTTDRTVDVVARIVEEVVGNRLTDSIREELGESYSPFGRATIGAGESPKTEFYISVSTGPDALDEVSAAVVEQLADLRDDGPTEREYNNATATVTEELNFFNNGQINDEVLDALVDPAGSADFDDYLREFELVSSVTADQVVDFLAQFLPADRYIEVRVVPRS